ncbi:MAG: aldo/keto reductase [Mesorhizobium sp.]|uniref:aldo/keto reductase n=1 Tax=Mesorhizobium sp. TaxID=1871066 RepID=UPI000FEAA6AE|nr:aldo/keto reductase [Mesorhizobium sp.]RWL84463.1 MAG: aldo/keto reductase [Mesorhizobium sp.]RWL88058.1 MAG: aldo/keto reductase [Mesorhizobium sp.]RWL96581.1 MAG: aldo/keto reductase [Mesorhizobium sp.]RWM01785.1 MAG: aldo/keto reductase [Mesorhizobium sp.]TIP44708.1 MAG: aldo/keto reductase [Mesorhizobium sp.]
MKPSDKRVFGRSGLNVTAFAFGTAPIGNFLQPIDEQTADAMIQTAWDAGIRFYDTAPMYGHGLSELRAGHSLRWKKRDEFVLASKVGRLLKPAKRSEIDFAPWSNAAPNTMNFDYSYDGTMRSFEDSLQRLALEHIDMLFIHDIDRFTRGDEQPEVFRQAMDGCWRALEQLRSEGVVKAIGVGVNEWQVCHEALKQRDFDCFLLAGRYTLLEQEALDEFLPLCVERGAAVLVGGGFNSGILATGAVPGAKYNYSQAPKPVMERVARIEEVCRAHGVPLPAAALQFVVAHPAIPSFCAGTRTVQQLEQNLAWFSYPIPVEFWQDLKKNGLLREDAPVPA